MGLRAIVLGEQDMRFVSGVAVGAALVFASPALAATVSPLQGEVWINHGQGYQRVNGQMEARVGDSVMVGPQGLASITYSDGCTVEVKPVAVQAVGELSPCTSGSVAQQNTNTDNTGLYLMGGAAVLGGAAAAALLTKNNNSNAPSPTSP